MDMDADIPVTGTITLTPDWANMRQWLAAVAKTDLTYAHSVNAWLGSEAIDIGPAETLTDPPAPHTPCGGAGSHPSGMSCDECRPDLWDSFPEA